MLELENLLKTDKKIGISLSGGADSALLAYIALMQYNRKIHFFTFASKKRYYRTVKYSIDVIKRCIELLGSKDIHHHIKYEEVYDRTVFLNYLNENINSGLVDVIVTATTSVPSLDERNEFKTKINDSNFLQRRNPDIKKNLYSNDRKFFSPFINLTKKDIFNIYKDLNLLDSLFSVTFSCESDDNVMSHCEKCWWCEERYWAFGKY